MRVLLVESDTHLAKSIRIGLERNGYAVDWLREGANVVQYLTLEPYELLMLDLDLPNIDGLELLSAIRNSGILLPILVLAARDTVKDRITSLDHGADDYMVKPFDLDELYARIRALLRRNFGRASSHITHGDIILDTIEHTLKKGGIAITLTSREYSILHLLIGNVGRVLSKDQIEDHILGWNNDAESNATEVHIHNLRKKIGKELIQTVRGIGYKIPKVTDQH